jgi:hypothetical protein
MQFAVDHGADEGRRQIGGDGPEQTPRAGPARALQRATVRQVDFDQVALFDKMGIRHDPASFAVHAAKSKSMRRAHLSF